MYVYPFITLVSCFVYFWCARSVRISLAGRVIYFLCGTPLFGVPGRYNFIWRFHGAGGGTVQIFLVSWLCSGYGTVEVVKGVVRFFLLFQFLVSSAVGIFLCYMFRSSLVDLWYYLVVFYFVADFQ